MVETQLNIFDTIVIGILVLSCLIAFFRGLVREILSLIAWVGAAVVTGHYFLDVAQWLEGYFKSGTVAAAVAMAGVFVGALMGLGIVNMLIIKTVKQSGETGMLDNLLGLIFGALRGAFIVCVGFLFLGLAGIADQDGARDQPKWLAQSLTRPYIEKGTELLASRLPDAMRDLSLAKKHLPEDEESFGDDEEPAYREETTRQLDRLIESSGPAR